MDYMMNKSSANKGKSHASSSKKCLLAAMLIGSAGFAVPAFGQVINEDHKILASDGNANDRFGLDVAIDNGNAVVGATWNDKNGTNSGSAYVFDASTGSQIVILHAVGGLPYDTFGSSVAIEKDVVAVGAMNFDNFWVKAGAAYLFDRSTGAQLFQLLPSVPVPSANFGNSIAMDNQEVVVGAVFDGISGSQPGAVYHFDATTGVQTAKLVASDGANGDEFGHSVAIDGNIVAIGAPRDDDNGNNSGSVYLFDISTSTQIAKLLPSDGAAQDRFGWSVAIRDGVVAVGSYLDDDNGSNSGSVYLFDAGTGAQISKILPNSGAADEWFGWSVALDDGILAVASTMSDDYLFDVATGTQIGQLLPTDVAIGDNFGWSVAMDQGIVVASSLRDDDNGIDSGSAYLFDISCRVDLNNDGVLDYGDVSLFLSLFNSSDPAADWNYDGSFNQFDVSAFMAAFSEGC